MRRFRDLSGEVLFFNESVFTFNIVRGELIDYCITGREFLPYEFRLYKSERDAIMFFLDDRVLPETRIGIQEDLKYAGIPYFDMTMIIKYSNGFSFEDNYWVRFSEGIQTWDDLIYARFGGSPVLANDYAQRLREKTEFEDQLSERIAGGSDRR